MSNHIEETGFVQLDSGAEQQRHSVNKVDGYFRRLAKDRGSLLSLITAALCSWYLAAWIKMHNGDQDSNDPQYPVLTTQQSVPEISPHDGSPIVIEFAPPFEPSTPTYTP